MEPKRPCPHWERRARGETRRQGRLQTRAELGGARPAATGGRALRAGGGLGGGRSSRHPSPVPTSELGGTFLWFEAAPCVATCHPPPPPKEKEGTGRAKMVKSLSDVDSARWPGRAGGAEAGAGAQPRRRLPSRSLRKAPAPARPACPSRGFACAVSTQTPPGAAALCSAFPPAPARRSAATPSRHLSGCRHRLARPAPSLPLRVSQTPGPPLLTAGPRASACAPHRPAARRCPLQGPPSVLCSLYPRILRHGLFLGNLLKKLPLRLPQSPAHSPNPMTVTSTLQRQTE